MLEGCNRIGLEGILESPAYCGIFLIVFGVWRGIYVCVNGVQLGIGEAILTGDLFLKA